MDNFIDNILINLTFFLQFVDSKAIILRVTAN